MQILYLHHFYTTLDMAGGTRCYELARRLAAAGHQVHLITSLAELAEKDGDKWLHRQEAGFHVHSRAIHYSEQTSPGRKLLSLLQFNWLAMKRAKDIGADVVFASSPPLSIVLAAIGIAHTRKIPLVLEVRSPWPELPVEIGVWRNPLLILAAKLVESLAYRSAAHIITLSVGMRESITRQGIAFEKVTVIPNGYDPALFELPADGRQSAQRFIPDLSEEQPLILYTGTFDRLHSVGYIVELAAALHPLCPEARFLLVGSGTQVRQITRQARTSGAWHSYLWVEKPIPKKDIPKLLSAATLTISTVIARRAVWNNAASKFPESLAAGKPVAINYRGWQADLLDETGAGIILPAQDPERAAHLLAAFLSDSSRMQIAADAARALARQRFSYDHLAHDLEEALSRAVQAPVPCPR